MPQSISASPETHLRLSRDPDSQLALNLVLAKGEPGRWFVRKRAVYDCPQHPSMFPVATSLVGYLVQCGKIHVAHSGRQCTRLPATGATLLN